MIGGETLKFDLGGSTTAADLLAVTGSASVSGTVNVSINTFGSTPLSPGTYNLITAALGGLNGGTWLLTNGLTTQTVTVGGTLSSLQLNASSTAVSLTVATVYPVTYNANVPNGATLASGAVPVDGNSPYVSGATVTVLDNSGNLIVTGYAFTGWNTQANGSGTPYSAGGTFTISSATTLYAQWQLVAASGHHQHFGLTFGVQHDLRHGVSRPDLYGFRHRHHRRNFGDPAGRL